MTPAGETNATLPLLADPAGYVRCRWDLATEHHHRPYWLGLFRAHFPTLLDEASKVLRAQGVDEDDIRARTGHAATSFAEYLDLITHNPGHAGRLDIYDICIVRERSLRDAGIDDPYLLAKKRENEAALAVLPHLLAELDKLGESERQVRLIEGIFAGNIFDLGATSTNDLFRSKSVDFHGVRSKLKPRRWLIDDLDAWIERMRRPAHRCALLFVDNAGCDVLLGMLPFARGLLARGTDVILAANPTPSLNDITLAELTELVGRIAAWDKPIGDALRDGRLELVSSGNTVPLIDLTRVAPGLAEITAKRGVDLVVLEGMGRGVESNLDAAFTCDAMKIAMIKDRGVAEALNGTLYDLVIRFDAV